MHLHTTGNGRVRFNRSLQVNASSSLNPEGVNKASAKCKASIDYNKELANSTAVWAILDWLRDEHRNGIWARSIRGRDCLPLYDSKCTDTGTYCRGYHRQKRR
ncbi:hypothetical protein BDN71DRAFT_16857 [Pleurotus eryngii]|uniref:Uncharacterized protein n=1 Tax=Pleurotus eryngii TaxID=5323 RepID=A0A9P6AAM9_PLEER|nr:hypothetical protein BDN71DRAFT_16857 [Pleurotus eryngii]